MTKEENAKPKKGVSRREFIAGTVGGVVVGAVAGAAAGSLGFPRTITQTLTQTTTSVTTAQPWLPAKWDYSADVVVVGGGASGMAAAVSAAQAKASVILLEKMPALGGDVARSYGNISAAGTSIQAAKGISDTPAQYLADLQKTSGPRTRPEYLSLLANNAGQMIEWLLSLGVTFTADSPIFRAGNTVLRSHDVAPDARQLAVVMGNNLKTLGVQVMLSAPATQLIRDPTNGVIGVQASGPNQNVLNIKASKAVVLAAGDQGANKTMLGEFASPGWYTTLPSAGTPGNTGDLLLAASAVGADPICLDQTKTAPFGPGMVVGNGDKNPEATYGNALAILSYSIWVSSAGNRFTNELGATVALDTFNQPGSVSYLIFDNTTAALNPVMVGCSYLHFQDWVAQGVVKQASTLADLATALGVDPTGLSSTVAKYNGYVAAKSDPDFKRPNPGPAISTPPFYGVGPCNVYSNQTVDGTLSVSFPAANSPFLIQVLDVFGKSIPRLFAAGLMGKGGVGASISGAHTAWAVTSGHMLGTAVASLQPWD